MPIHLEIAGSKREIVWPEESAAISILTQIFRGDPTDLRYVLSLREGQVLFRARFSARTKEEHIVCSISDIGARDYKYTDFVQHPISTEDQMKDIFWLITHMMHRCPLVMLNSFVRDKPLNVFQLRELASDKTLIDQKCF